MIVVDASVWIDYLTDSLDHRYLTALLGEPVSPPHVDFEVGSGLLRRQRHGQLGDDVMAVDLVTGFAAMPFIRERKDTDQVAAFELTNNASYADALYLVVAKRLRCPVMTSDNGMIEAAKIIGVEITDTRN